MWNEPSKERLSQIPKLYGTEHIPIQEKLIHLHFFIGACDWFIAEFDGVDTFWGFAILNNDFLNAEWGYVTFSELKSIKANGWLEIDCELEEFWKIRRAVEIEKIRKACGWEKPTSNDNNAKGESMNMRQIEEPARQACWDGIIEIECSKCGAMITAEPDATDLYCPECDKFTTKNPLTELGFV